MNERLTITPHSQEYTLLSSIYNRKLALKQFPDLFFDKECEELFKKVAFFPKKVPFKEVKISAILDATRQNDFLIIYNAYLERHPNASVIVLGCGLDTALRQLKTEGSTLYNIDYPDVMEARNRLLPPKSGEVNIGADLLQLGWVKHIKANAEDGILFVAPNLFYTWKTEDVKKLLLAIAEHFKGARIAFDATNKRGSDRLQKLTKSPSAIEKTDLFSVDKAADITAWSEAFMLVEETPLMSGFSPLSKDFGRMINLFFLLLDRLKWTKIIEIKVSQYSKDEDDEYAADDYEEEA